MEIRFESYVETPGEKHMGIATIFYGTLLLRFKIQPGKDGNGFYAQAASHKIVENGVDRYVESFMIDSRIEHMKIMEMVKEGVKAAQSKEVKMVGSIFEEKLSF
jgi:hypothetical protein